jgi:uncharacterized membrane protein YhhN
MILQKNRLWLTLYFIVTAIHLDAIAMRLHMLQNATKVLLMPLLALYLLSAIRRLRPAIFRNLLLTALFFSWAGDVLLIKEQYFLPGLGSFLLAHLAYIGFFLKVRYTNHPLPLCKYPFIFLTEIVVLAFLFFMLPYLGSMRVPVIIYAIAISFTLLCAMHAFRLGEQPMGWYCIAGAILFICSDAAIALQHFYSSLPAAGIFIMTTYCLAQWAITEGSCRYLKSRVKA